jgi:ABC-type sugar transport system substrate-binding protein
MFRRLFLTVLILAIIIAGSGSIVLAEENEIEIAFIRATGEPYYQYGSQAAEVAAKKLGVNMVVYTSNLDSAQESASNGTHKSSFLIVFFVTKPFYELISFILVFTSA